MTQLDPNGTSISAADFNGDGLPDLVTDSVIILNSSH
jgi:hypothetical protein